MKWNKWAQLAAHSCRWRTCFAFWDSLDPCSTSKLGCIVLVFTKDFRCFPKGLSHKPSQTNEYICPFCFGIISISHRNVSVPCMGLGSKGNPWIWEIAALRGMQPTSTKTSGNRPRSEDNLSCVLYDWLTGMLTVCNWKHLDSGTERLKYIQNHNQQIVVG